MRFLGKLVVLIVLAVVALGVWLWSGSYDIGADAPHWGATAKVIGVLRERSIETRAAGIKVPPLNDAALIAEGAEHYAGMCTECHLAPGMTDSETRAGLYPRPPNLSRFAPDPAAAFWIIKHGIKMSGMPAWGKTHDDQKIWAMVAFLQQQPTMSVAQYRALTANAHDEDDEHSHADAGHDAMPGMAMPAAASSSAPAAAGTAKP